MFTKHVVFVGNGYYLYIESSSPRTPGNKAELESTTLPGGSQYCLTFYYNMLGATMGALHIYKEVNNLHFTCFLNFLLLFHSFSDNLWLQKHCYKYTQRSSEIFCKDCKMKRRRYIFLNFPWSTKVSVSSPWAISFTIFQSTQKYCTLYFLNIYYQTKCIYFSLTDTCCRISINLRLQVQITWLHLREFPIYE